MYVNSLKGDIELCFLCYLIFIKFKKEFQCMYFEFLLGKKKKKWKCGCQMLRFTWGALNDGSQAHLTKDLLVTDEVHGVSS